MPCAFRYRRLKIGPPQFKGKQFIELAGSDAGILALRELIGWKPLYESTRTELQAFLLEPDIRPALERALKNDAAKKELQLIWREWRGKQPAKVEKDDALLWGQ